mgnify:CR=1 FL=1
MDKIARQKRHNRIRSHMHGTAGKPRLVVYKSLMATYAQLVNDDKGVTLATVHDLKKHKGTKLESAKEVGMNIAKLALAQKISECVFDRAGYKYHGRVKAVAEGAREGGLQF